MHCKATKLIGKLDRVGGKCRSQKKRIQKKRFMAHERAEGLRSWLDFCQLVELVGRYRAETNHWLAS